MEGMKSNVEVVESELDNIVVFDNEGVHLAIDYWVF